MFKIFGGTKEGGSVKEMLHEKMGLKGLEYPVAKHAQRLPYMLGGVTLAGFVLLFATGAFMAQYYNPNQLSSHQSVAYIISQVPFGNFIRSVHFWTSNIVFIVMMLHMVRAFISGSYKSPREFTWFAGLGLFAVTIGFLFTGTMLSLGQEALEAMQHSSEVGALVGSLGLWFTGGFSTSVPLIGRVYVGHISMLVMGFILFLSAHFYLVHVHGVSPKADRDATVGATYPEGSQSFTDHLRRLAGWAFILYAVIALFALLSPEPLGASGATGVNGPEVKPPWMFMWLYGMEDAFGIKALVWGPVALFAALGLIPLIDRSPYLSPRRRPFIMTYGAAILIALVGFTVQAYRTSPNMAGMEEGMRPKTIPFAFLLPGKYAEAHNMVMVTFTPPSAEPGDAVSIYADGLDESGTYEVSLVGLQDTIHAGTVTLAQGDDHFTVDLTLPSSVKGGLYTVEAMHMPEKMRFTAPLQLSVVSATNPLPDFNTDITYPIPYSEVPWIILFIGASFGAGVILLRES